VGTDNPQDRIDQVFSEETLIGEAVEVAAADALERHRKAETPLVILRDGRPVDALSATANPDEPLTTSTLEKVRSVAQLISWFDNCLDTINRDPAVKRRALLHQGIFKRFYEEVYPFALFVRTLYGGREDVVCRLEQRGDLDYDALIQGNNKTRSTTYVQLTTTAYDHDQSLRMRHFLQHGRVSVFGPIDRAGRPQYEFVAHDDLLGRAFTAIEDRIKLKSKFKHGPDYALVVSFDDWLWFGTGTDLAALSSFIRERLAGWHLSVGTLYIVGLSGRTFLSFPVLAAS
jgi:hypothetical protein